MSGVLQVYEVSGRYIGLDTEKERQGVIANMCVQMT